MNLQDNLMFLAPLIKAFREHLLADEDRPGYHFCVPEGLGQPGDPNGCFYANGRYHMMYLYKSEESGFCWGHVSSADLLHWRHHPDCLVAGPVAKGCFSGGAFLDDDGRCYLSFWDFVDDARDAGGIRIAVSEGEPYEAWEILPEYAVRCNVSMGVGCLCEPVDTAKIIGVADPSNIWKKGKTYYMQTGNLLVLDGYSRGKRVPKHLRGDWTELFSSDDLRHWQYEGRFYDRQQCLHTDDSEDCMCPSFLPLPAGRDGGAPSGKYLQLFISHNRGCQYYVGKYDEKKNRFLPRQHGRMSVVDSAYFAPEALVDAQGRQVMWSWLRDDPSDAPKRGWSGVFGMARELWYEAADNSLRMAPARAYETLRINPQSVSVDVRKSKQAALAVQNGLSFELEIANIAQRDRDAFALRVRESADGSEYTLVYFDAATGEIVLDSTKGSLRGWPAVERIPVALPEDEALCLRVFVDKSVVEVFANDRAAACRRVYPAQNGAGVSVVKRNKGCRLQLSFWEIACCNPF